MTKLSEHFTLEELTSSDTADRLGIDNSPTLLEIEHAKQYLVPGLEQLRELFKKPIVINSGFRSKALNKAVPGSSDTSQHTKFEAADIRCPEFGNILSLAKAIIASDIKFDQLIYEYGSWIHISFSAKPRRSVLTKWSGQPYKTGLWTQDGKRIA